MNTAQYRRRYTPQVPGTITEMLQFIIMIEAAGEGRTAAPQWEKIGLREDKSVIKQKDCKEAGNDTDSNKSCSI